MHQLTVLMKFAGSILKMMSELVIIDVKRIMKPFGISIVSLNYPLVIISCYLDGIVTLLIDNGFKNKKIVEIGCGKGYFFEKLIKAGFDVTGFDPVNYEQKLF